MSSIIIQVNFGKGT